MKDEKSVTKEEELEIVEIAEFKRNDTRRQISRHKELERRRRQNLYVISVLYAVGFLAAVLISVFMFRLPAVLVCLVLVLESVIAACLYERSVWVHLLEIAIGIAAGIVYGKVALMVVGTLIYLGAVIALRWMRNLKSRTGWR